MNDDHPHALLARFTGTKMPMARVINMEREDFHQEVWAMYLAEHRRGTFTGPGRDHEGFVWVVLSGRVIDLVRRVTGERRNRGRTGHLPPLAVDPHGPALDRGVTHDDLDPPLSVQDLLASLPEDLTPRQRLVVRRLLAGWTKHAVAGELGVSPTRVSHHVREIRAHLADWTPVSG